MYLGPIIMSKRKTTKINAAIFSLINCQFSVIIIFRKTNRNVKTPLNKLWLLCRKTLYIFALQRGLIGEDNKKKFCYRSGEMQPYEYTRTIKLFANKILKTCVFYKRKIWSLKMTSIYSIKKCVEKLVSDLFSSLLELSLMAGAFNLQLTCQRRKLDRDIQRTDWLFFHDTLYEKAVEIQ